MKLFSLFPLGDDVNSEKGELENVFRPSLVSLRYPYTLRYPYSLYNCNVFVACNFLGHPSTHYQKKLPAVLENETWTTSILSKTTSVWDTHSTFATKSPTPEDLLHDAVRLFPVGVGFSGVRAGTMGVQLALLHV